VQSEPEGPVDVAELDRFHVAQRFTLMVNRYDVATLAEDGRGPGRPVCFVEQKRLALKEDLRAFRDESKAEELFRIKARQVFDPAARYAVTDGEGRRLGELRKVFGRSLLRSTWEVFDASDRLLASARERSLAVALWRRFVQLAPAVGDALASIPVPFHFEILRDGRPLGELRRVYSLRDRYVLDLSGDGERTIDRRLAIALAIGLDALQAR
jgi:uncharacterized protein YxjI